MFFLWLPNFTGSIKVDGPIGWGVVRSLFIYFLCVVGPTRGEGFRSIKPEPIRLRVEFHSAALGRRALAGFFSSFFGFFFARFLYPILPGSTVDENCGGARRSIGGGGFSRSPSFHLCSLVLPSYAAHGLARVWPSFVGIC